MINNQMKSNTLNSCQPDTPSFQWQATILGKNEPGYICLAQGGAKQFDSSQEIEARCAVSCIIQPEIGDRVLCYSDEVDGVLQTYILAILARESESVNSSSKSPSVKKKVAKLTVPDCDQLRIVQPHIQCHASNKIELGCVKDIKFTSARGNLEICAQNVIKTVFGSIIESAKERISHAEFTQFCSSFLTRIHSNQTILTADSDIKIDAERVNLG